MIKEIGYFKDVYGSIIEVIFIDGKWIHKSPYVSHNQIIEIQKGSQVYDTPFEANIGKRKRIKKFSNKKSNFNTFIERTSTGEKGE